jgi:hypothetical protein
MAMKNLDAKLLLIAVAPLLSACLTARDADNRWNYVCPGGYEFTVEFSTDGDDVIFTDAEQQLDLERRETASGARYTDGSFVSVLMARLCTRTAWAITTVARNKSCAHVNDISVYKQN